MTTATTIDDRYIASVLLLCVECKQPIRATITSPQWLRVEWIGPNGQCQACNQKAKEANSGIPT